MKGYNISGFGGADVLNYVELPDPDPDPGPQKVVVRINATTYNPVDMLLASGKMQAEMPISLPWTPGADFSGMVIRTGSEVTGLHDGVEVYGYSPKGGAYAQEIAVDASTVALKPQTLSDGEAASLALVGQTALQALTAMNLKAGQQILIHGAAGGVGSAAVQIAHALGAFVIGTGTASNLELIKSLGADLTIDYQKTAFDAVAGELDGVLDTVGGETQERSFSVLKPGGYLIALSQPPSPGTASRYGVRAVMLNTEPSAASLNVIGKYVASGQLRPLIGKTVPLSEAPTVWRDRKSIHVAGKIVFTVRTFA